MAKPKSSRGAPQVFVVDAARDQAMTPILSRCESSGGRHAPPTTILPFMNGVSCSGSKGWSGAAYAHDQLAADFSADAENTLTNCRSFLP